MFGKSWQQDDVVKMNRGHVHFVMISCLQSSVLSEKSTKVQHVHRINTEQSHVFPRGTLTHIFCDLAAAPPPCKWRVDPHHHRETPSHPDTPDYSPPQEPVGC